MMPVCRLDPWTALQPQRDLRDELESLFGSDEDEIFRGVDLSAVDIDDFDLSVFDSEEDSDGESDSRFREVRNHDCMWGGQCCNKEFQRTQAPPPPPVKKVVTIQKCVPVPAGRCSERTDVLVVTNNVRTPLAKSEGRSLLLNRTNPPVPRNPPVPIPSRPETPQSLSGSDDDFAPIPIDPHNTTSVFRSALDALTTPGPVDWEDDAPARTKPSFPHADTVRVSASAVSDHNYDCSGKTLRLEGLGVDTPSDSEEDEEIDVVSLSERSCSSRSSSCGGLPTRPTPRDQEHLEEITTSLLSASEAVSRKLKKTIKRKRYQSESSEDDEDDDEESEESVYHQQTKRQKGSPGQLRRKKVNRFGEEGEDSQEKRDLHNNMERMRRIDLRNSFEELKALVPGVANKDRAAKVVILREAANYCCELGAESQSKCMQVMALRKEQERLRSMVSSLRKAAAMACVKAPKRY